MTGYRAIPASIDLPKMEHEVLSFWQRNAIFHQSVKAHEGQSAWTFFEGPPTANGMPGTHHIEARVFKDVFPRYQTMKGHQVIRKAGWDCHGLPVEIAVEKELGFSGKEDIEKFGIAEFNAKCKESVQRHVDAFTTMTNRMGFWVDFDEAYWTMSAEYVESVWWSLKEIWKKGLLVQDHRVAPYCPRCGTGLSDHELSQGYETVTDPSAYVRFPITSGELQELKASFLVWTTTPWTLISNTALAANAEIEYVAVRVSKDDNSEVLVLAQELLCKVDGETEILKRFKGKELEHITYSRPFDVVEIPDAHFVVLADYVTTEEGSGLVHQAPAFGADDLKTCRAYNLPTVNPIRPDGHFEAGIELVGDLFFKDADKPIVKDLKERGLLFKHQPYEHQYPHCWRCHTALIYYAQPSWYIRTTSIKDALIRENLKTDWHPETIKTGRFGDWLNNNIDWALSRNRYWGTPLPIWRCASGENTHDIAIGSLKELGQLSGQELSNMDPHRPFVDDIKFPCLECADGKNLMVRVPEVIDCWYDSGAMPFAQWGYPHKVGSEKKFKDSYPANFICEAIDQTRGWFYTLMTIGTLVFDQSSYKTVLCLGHILDKDGRKMSKHLGNVLEPMALMDQHGADAVRWFMLAAGSPWAARRVGHDAIQEVIRKTLLTYWNTISFMSLYARASNFDLSQSPTQIGRPIMDRWILSELQLLVKEVDVAYADFDSQAAGRLIATFIDDLSNWYVRRSRRRFWDGDPAALATLHECLKVLTQLMSPMVPFITEHVWQELIKPVESDAATSIHLTSWPEINTSLIDENLRNQVALTRRIVELGRAARAESAVKIRQPLHRALISASGWANLPTDMRDQIADELNVLELEDIANASGELVSVSIKANFRALGARYGGAVQDVAKLIASADAASLVAQVRIKGTAELGAFEITTEDLVITENPKSGWSVASNNGESVALDLTLTQALIDAGNVREVIRALQEGRKNSGFDISDRILVSWNATPEIAAALLESMDHIKREVLAIEMKVDSSLLCDTQLGFTFNLIKA